MDGRKWRAFNGIIAYGHTMNNQIQNQLYDALVRRDASLDGQYFFGVKTTGIYCRPICPAPKPKRENVLYFANADEAEDAGFRACKRCRPETRQGSPAWTLTQASVSRAIRLMKEADDTLSVEDLADRVGLSARQLRRLFKAHTGLSPKEYMIRSRLRLAENLLKNSDHSVTDISLAAGFGSLRRFHDAWARTHRQSPSDWRTGF